MLYLQQEVSLNRMVVIPPTQVPLPHKPTGQNDGIDRDMCSISYITIEQVVEHNRAIGPGHTHGKSRHQTGLLHSPSSPRRPPPVGRPMERSSGAR